MTREDVISRFKEIRDWTEFPYFITTEMIDMAIQALEQTRWMPLTKRPTTEEEREYYKGWPDAGDDVVFDGELPENNQEVIVSCGDDVRTDIFCKEDGGYHFECVDIRKVEAWMPLPEPYKQEVEE